MKINGFDNSVNTEKLISAALSAGRFPHSVIIEGGTPEERLKLASKTAQALLCSSDEAIPCGECSNCLKADHGMHPDISFYKPRKEKGHVDEAFSVDYIREIRDEAFIIPNEADRRIFVLCEAQKMNIQAQNAFLKVLEEPPTYAVFILLTESRNVFLPTVLSRMTVYSMGEATGAVFDGCTPEELREYAEKTAKAIVAPNSYELVKAVGAFDKNQKLLEAVIPQLYEIFATALRLKFNANGNEEASEAAQLLSSRLSRNALLRLSDSTVEISDGIKMHANLNLTLVRLCALYRAAATEQE